MYERRNHHRVRVHPVRLSAASREDLLLAETAVDSSTTTRDTGVGEFEGEATITSHVATYQRGPARGRPTLLEAFLGGINGTPGPGAGVVVTGDDLGVGELSVPIFEADVTIPGSRWSLVVPAAARDDGDVALAETMVLVPGTAISGSALVPDDEWIPGARWIPGSRWFPRSSWMSGDEWIPGARWFPGLVYDFENPHDVSILLATRERSPEQVFDLEGADYDGPAGRPFDEGETFETETDVLAVPGDAIGEQLDPTNGYDPTDVYDGGTPAPTGGGPFGFGVLSTPDAEVDGQSVNPVAGMDLGELLTSDAARGMLRETGVTDADEAEWLAGPEEITDEVATGGQDPFVILDREADHATFAGILDGDDGPWGVLVNVARVTDEDVVVAAGTQTTPLGSAEAPANWLEFGGESQEPGPHRGWFTGGRELSAATSENLEPGPREN